MNIFSVFRKVVLAAFVLILFSGWTLGADNRPSMQIQLDPRTQQMVIRGKATGPPSGVELRKQVMIRKLLPPLSGNSFETEPCETKVTFSMSESEQGKKPEIQVKAEGGLVFGQSISVQDFTRKPIKLEPTLFVWCNGATHVFADVVSLARYTFEPAAGSTLSFRVDQAKGYVFMEGKGRVKTPKEDIIEFDESKSGLVVGSPARAKK